MKASTKKIVLVAVLIILVVCIVVFFALFIRNQGRTSSLPGILQSSQSWVDKALAEKPCPTVTKPEPYLGSYTGPMLDAHIHIAPIPDGPAAEMPGPDENPQLGSTAFIDEYVCMMQAEGTHKVLAFFPVWDPVRGAMLEVAKRTMQKYPNRFIPFIMPPNRDDRPDGFPTVDADTLSEMLSVYPGLFKGYGEIGLYARDGGSPELKPDSGRLTAIYPVVRNNRLLVYFHLGRGQKDEFENVLAQNRDITFIFHGDQLIEDAGGGDTLTLIDEILTQHPNVRYGVDELYGDVFLLNPGTKKADFLAHFDDFETLLVKDLKSWQWFIEKHPDQVMWDTDRGWSAPWSLDPEVAVTINRYFRAFIGRLDPAVQEKYAYKNAEALLSR